MIQSVQINNFQSHKDTHLKFDKGVNMIVGSSDSGKTAIIRALKWLVQNRPQGDSMRSHWGGETKVELFTDDAHIVRIRDKQDEYVLGDTHFRAIRTEVPKEIQDALNLTELNLQLQLDRPFLLDNSAGEVAAHFNRVARLDKIDLGNQNVNRWVKELNQTIDSLKSQVENTEQELTKFVHLEKFEAEVEVLEELDKKLTGLKNSRNKLTKIISDNQQIDDVLVGYSELTDMESGVQEILDLFEEREKTQEYADHLSKLIYNYQGWQLDIDMFESLLSLEDSVNEVLVWLGISYQLETEYKKISAALTEYEDLITSIVDQKQLQDQYETQFAELMPNVCPLCESNISHEHGKR